MPAFEFGPAVDGQLQPVGTPPTAPIRRPLLMVSPHAPLLVDPSRPPQSHPATLGALSSVGCGCGRKSAAAVPAAEWLRWQSATTSLAFAELRARGCARLRIRAH